ncbi:MAG: DNA (cytosine-5-)-methyltransferase [Defluviitaleaceae bacterium]|nr:DNA (cytosine-5-)-methyltransferase [Defluviitaleaceae bacterium]
MQKFIDLFAGIGGLRLGFEQAAAQLNIAAKAVFSAEIKPHAIKVYSENFHENSHCDITTVNESNLPNFDFLLAGFPCQAFSNAGKRLGFDDTRGTLFFDVARIIRAKNPKGFLLENVEGLLTHNGGETLRTIIRILTDLGYFVDFAVLDSKNFGLAQSRKRIYICGGKSGKIPLDELEKSEKPPKTAVLADIIENDIPPIETAFTKKLFSHFNITDVIGKQIKDKRGGAANIHSWDFALKGEISQEQKNLLALLLKKRRSKKWAEIYGIDWMDGMPLTFAMIKTFFDVDNLQALLDDLVAKNYLVLEFPKKKAKNARIYDKTQEKGYNIVTGKLSFEFNRILDPNQLTPTLVATDMLKLAVPVGGGLRTLTKRESLRLFGFPENYTLDSVTQNEAFDLLGNTVCVPVVAEVAKILIKSAKGAVDNG